MENGLPTSYKLNDGTSIPSVGLGSMGNKDVANITAAVMEAGYVHIDTAAMYGNEEQVGEALQECFKQGKKREDVYITTKLFPTHSLNFIESAKECLKKLQLEKVDLMLLHHPLDKTNNKPMHLMWPEFEKMVDQGIATSIGVSNINTQLLYDLLQYARIKPVVNQIELNPQNS
jgi:diketogulonate reductase-like aldo/keto reductase